jgi:5-methylcytosine-specific restriction endonuclease McrA
MKNKKLNAEHVWKQIEDELVPRLNFSVTDRAVYYHLLRHSRLEGKLRLRFSMSWLTSGVRLSRVTARRTVRSLADRGVLRLVERNAQAGHVVEVLLPDEIRSLRPAKAEAPRSALFPHVAELENTDFLATAALRGAIHARESGSCFYCLRRIEAGARCLDHVVPRTQSGSNSYCNLVSCCLECNSRKGECSAEDFLRLLYRDRRLTEAELTARLGALDALAAGKLQPPLAGLAAPRTSGEYH